MNRIELAIVTSSQDLLPEATAVVRLPVRYSRVRPRDLRALKLPQLGLLNARSVNMRGVITDIITTSRIDFLALTET